MTNRDITHEIRDEYLLFKFAPGFVLTHGSVGRMWREIGELRDRTGISCALLVGSGVTRNMTTEDALESAMTGARAAPGIAMAMCIEGYEVDALTEFFCNACKNRGVKVQFFSDLAEAMGWLGVGESPAALWEELSAPALG